MMYIIIIDPRSIGSEHGSLNTESVTTSKKETQNDQHPGIIRPMEDKILLLERTVSNITGALDDVRSGLESISRDNPIIEKIVNQNPYLGPFLRNELVQLVQGRSRAEEDTIILERLCNSYNSIDSMIRKLHQFNSDLNRTLQSTIASQEQLNAAIFTLRRGTAKLLIFNQDWQEDNTEEEPWINSSDP